MIRNAEQGNEARVGAALERTAEIEKDERRKDPKGILLFSVLSVTIGCLCCISPFVLVLFGLASVATAVSVDNVLTGQYVWVFRIAALLFLALGLVVYFRRRGICTLDAARRQRNSIINTVILTLLLVIGGYIAFEYIVLEYWGARIGLPWAPERWAFPAAGVLLAAAGLLYLGFFRRTARSTQLSGGDPKNGLGPLVAGGTAAILAWTCCLGPLILVTLGISGAWIGNLTALEPYRPIFIGAALVALFFAYRSIFRPAQACKPEEVCGVPRVRAAYKVIFWIVAALVGIALAFPYVLPLFY